MNEMIYPLAQNDFPAKKNSDGAAFQSTGTICRTVAILCFALGFLSLVLGILLTITIWFTALVSPGFIAKSAIFSAIPLMMLGAHYLDKLDLMEKAAKKKRFEI